MDKNIDLTHKQVWLIAQRLSSVRTCCQVLYDDAFRSSESIKFYFDVDLAIRDLNCVENSFIKLRDSINEVIAFADSLRVKVKKNQDSEV